MQKSLILVTFGFLTINLLLIPEAGFSAPRKAALLLAQADEAEFEGEEGADESADEEEEAPTPKSSGKKIGGKKVSQAENMDLVESNSSVNMTGLEFRPNQNGGSIIVRTSGPAQYSSRMNTDTNQFILELPGTTIPKKYQRPFNTKEFAGAISIFTAYQSEGSRSSRIIVQLRDPVQISVQKEGNTLILIPSGSGKSNGSRARSEETSQEAEGEGEPVAVVNGRESQASSQAYSPAGEKKALNASLDEFVSGSMRYYGHPISVSFKEGDIRDVLNFIAEESGLNMVISEEVKGNVNIKLRKIPWDQALIIILQAKQLGYVRQGNILRIAPLDVLKREAENTKQTLDSQKSLTPLRTKIFRLNFAEARSLLTNIKVFLTPNRGQAMEDERSNSLIVT
ncbi:MAG: secretin and TonB N-terminal domain-containing protein, partial [Bdellovibrionales bacterium]|nr:secretin and TonB N-terminal domain-containing protein [Bdellovibrionales bacterium]